MVTYKKVFCPEKMGPVGPHGWTLFILGQVVLMIPSHRASSNVTSDTRGLTRPVYSTGSRIATIATLDPHGITDLSQPWGTRTHNLELRRPVVYTARLYFLYHYFMKSDNIFKVSDVLFIVLFNWVSGILCFVTIKGK